MKAFALRHVPVHAARHNSSIASSAPTTPARIALAASFCLLVATPMLRAQAFKLQGGTSTLLQGHGASVEVRGPNYVGRLGVGLMGDRPRFGFYFATTWRGILWGNGDQAISFSLPTDVFNRSYYFLGRGASASWKGERNSFFLFGGATSKGFTTPFLNLAQAETRTALLFFDRKLTRSLRFTSRNVLSSRQTFIQGLEWSPQDRTRLGVSAGLGSNQRYWATSFDFDRERLEIQASYSRAGDAFRRIRAEAPVSTELDRENVRIEWKPGRNLGFILSRNNYLAPLDSGQPNERASVNGLAAWTSVQGFQFHGSYYDSSTPGGRVGAFTFGGRRNWWNRLDTSLDYFRSNSAHGPAYQSVVGTVREALSPRIALTQVVTRSNGQTNISFGGSFLSNRFTASVEYQTIFLPFNTSNRSAFKQVLALNIRLRLWGGLELNGATDVTPLGKVRYTAYATTFAYRGVSYDPGGAPASGTIHNYIVRGRVVEANGQPVRGAALRIDGEMVFTDSQGLFSLRRKKDKECEISVALDQFILPGTFQIVSAPQTIKAEREEKAELHEVVLKRLPTAAPSAGAGQADSRVFGSGTKVQSGTVLELAKLPLTPRASTNLAFPRMAPRMPLESRGANSGHGSHSNNSRIPVGSYYYYPASGGSPIDLGPVRVQPAQRVSERHSGRADSGKRPRRVASTARP